MRDLVDQTSRATIAELAGVSCETVRRFLDGCPPSSGAVYRLCSALDVSADWLLFGIGPRERALHTTNPLDSVPLDLLLRAAADRLAQLRPIVGPVSRPGQQVGGRHVASARSARSLNRAASRPRAFTLLEGPAHRGIVHVVGSPPPQIIVARNGSARTWRILDSSAAARFSSAPRYQWFVGRTFRWVRDHLGRSVRV